MSKIIFGGMFLLLFGFSICTLTFKTVYSSDFYSDLSVPLAYIFGTFLAILGLYLLINEKIKIDRFLKLTKTNILLSFLFFVILCGIFLKLWPSPNTTCQAIGCEPIFESSRMLARFSFLFFVLSYLISAAITYSHKLVIEK